MSRACVVWRRICRGCRASEFTTSPSGGRGAQAGMTLVEMVIAMGMLVMFTAVVATVLSFTSSSSGSRKVSMVPTRCSPASAPPDCW